jgi:hypothetical protein
MKNIALCCLLFVAYIAGAVSQTPACNRAALQQDMKPTFHKVNGKPILMLAGVIKGDSGKTVSTYIHNTRAYEEVWMCSGGGAVVGGIAIGRALNRAKATVKTPNGFFCASACTIASMGGYARIIEPNARFVTHASSGAKSFGYETVKQGNSYGIRYKRFGQYDCGKNWSRGFCQHLRLFIKEAELPSTAKCQKPNDLDKVNTKCIYFDTRGSRYSNDGIYTNSLFSLVLNRDPNLSKQAIAIEMRGSLANELELLEYFQTMLVDGKSSLLNKRSYNHINANFIPVNIYDLAETNTYARVFSDDMRSIKNTKGDFEEVFAIWQVMLTDSELSLKSQISEYINQHNIDLGAAGKDALKMYDAMRTCQIQSSCRLEPHSARALGYHNMYGHE